MAEMRAKILFILKPGLSKALEERNDLFKLNAFYSNYLWKKEFAVQKARKNITFFYRSIFLSFYSILLDYNTDRTL